MNLSGLSLRAAVVVGGAAAVMLAAAPSATAHPLGNFTINHYSGLVVSPSGITDTAVIDAAEIPTYSQRASVDTDHDGLASGTERVAFARHECSVLAGQLDLGIDGVAHAWNVGSSSFSYRPGAAGLDNSRLECALSVEADLSKQVAITFHDGYLTDRVGWREITLAGDGMALSGASVGSRSVSDELRHYPNALLSSPLDERSVRLSATPGASTYDSALPTVSSVGWASRLLGRATATFDGLVGSNHLTLQVGLLAVLLSLVLGASHAALPGHGKTIMAAYMVGTRGTPKDAFLIGATVTLAHTTGVIVLGMIFSASATFAGERVLAVLGVISGALVAVIGVGLLRGSLKRRARAASGVLVADAAGLGHLHTNCPAPGLGHSHRPFRLARPEPALSSGMVTSTATMSRPLGSSVAHGASDVGGHDGEHRHGHDRGHRHGHRHDHSHDHVEERGFRRLTIVGMGLAGGLVPSPTALVVLLGAIALGRTAFGVLLVIGYGIGMAATLIGVGYLIAVMPKRLPKLSALSKRPMAARLVTNGPVLTACLVLVVGVGLALRSASPLV
jgi:nickel/cobalt exporter